MNLNSGDFIISKYSTSPGLIIEKSEDAYLVSIKEYKGDYKFIPKTEATSIKLNPSQELSILSNFSDWFYIMHTNIYQEIIIKNLNTYFL